MSQKASVADHYRAPDLIEAIEFGLVAMEKDRAHVTIDDLAPVDEFHVLGPLATGELIEFLGATPDMHVLDLGSGLGGPARRLAKTTGCKVTGVDLTEDYCRAGSTLNKWVGLDDQVTLSVGDATDLDAFAPASFDGAWTIHVAMNIKDKTRFYNEVARVLKPGARFVAFDIVTKGGQDIQFPVPWAREPENSHLATVEEMETELTGAGFEEIVFHDRTDLAVQFLEAAAAQRAQTGSPPPLGLHILFGPIFRDAFANITQNTQNGLIGVTAVTCRKPS